MLSQEGFFLNELRFRDFMLLFLKSMEQGATVKGYSFINSIET